MVEIPKVEIDTSTRPYPPIDRDPHFKRVVAYMRPSDYGVWAAIAASGPAIIWCLHTVMPGPGGPAMLRHVRRNAFYIGAFAGFLKAYQRSSLRFMGFYENSRETIRDLKEMKARVARGEPLYGRSILPENVQRIAAANSKNSQMMLHFIPWFNFVNHNHHGVDVTKYYEDAIAEEEEQQLAKKNAGSVSDAAIEKVANGAFGNGEKSASA
ncbi:hypothetical protein IWQ60_002007 [Tieghemiomyces parasiticus]|uniref:NADH-ubiquinone oxidoreductase 21 kDa subunit n=1 Tax=Tieghemiomyces parasiticus TaxID=78921 RepID=A0A9W8AFM0_9FUNG|nr:hypothetical protein IWQ60_002007 [Tieghemiomyces parasiticus]